MKRKECSLGTLHPSPSGALGLDQNLCHCCSSLCIFFFSLFFFISLAPFHLSKLMLATLCATPPPSSVPTIIPLICYLLSLLSCACPLLFIEYSQNYQQAPGRSTFAHNKSEKNSVINVTVKLYSSQMSLLFAFVPHWSWKLVTSLLHVELSHSASLANESERLSLYSPVLPGRRWEPSLPCRGSLRGSATCCQSSNTP